MPNHSKVILARPFFLLTLSGSGVINSDACKGQEVKWVIGKAQRTFAIFCFLIFLVVVLFSYLIFDKVMVTEKRFFIMETMQT